MALLGALLVYPAAIKKVSSLAPDHLALADHRTIYSELLRQSKCGELADPVTVKTALARAGTLDQVGGPAYINRLVDCAVTPSNAAEYARLIHDLAVRRDLIAIGEDIIGRAYDSQDDASAQLALVGQEVGAIKARSPAPIDINRYRADAIDARPEPEGRLILGSWVRHDCIAMVAGPAKSGKTFLMSQMAVAIAAGANLFHWQAHRAARVLYLDYETGWSLLRDRRAAGAAALPPGYQQNLFPLSYDDDMVLPKLDTPEGVVWLERQVDAFGAEVVVIDNVGKVTTDTVSDDATAKRLAQAYVACHRRGCGVIIGHHTGHDVSRAAGSRVFVNDVTATCLLDLIDDDPLTVDLRWTEVRLGDKRGGDFQPLRLRLHPRSLVMIPVSGEKPPRRPPPPSMAWAFRLIADLIRDYGVHATLPEGVARPGTSAIYFETFTQEYRARMPGSTDSDAKREAQGLVKAGCIGFRSNMLWIP